MEEKILKDYWWFLYYFVRLVYAYYKAYDYAYDYA